MTRRIAVVVALAASVLVGLAPTPASAQDTQYTVAATGIQSPTLPFTNGGYTANGQFSIIVGNGNCAGTYTVSASPLAGSGPGGSTPPITVPPAYGNFSAGNFQFPSAGVGTYRVTVTETGPCNPPVDPTTLDVVVPDASSTQHIVTPSGISTPLLPFSDPGYVANGQFTINVANGACVGTYTVAASPLAGSGPGGSTPPATTTTTYTGVAAGGFPFVGAGPGTYRVTVTETGPSCNPTVNPVIVDVVVLDASATQHTVTPSGIAGPSLPVLDPGYVANGQFTIIVANGSCVGVFTVAASPLAGSGPGGSTPPFTATTAYNGFPAGNRLFASAGAGTYRVTVTETGPSCNPPVNPVIVDVVVPGTLGAVGPLAPAAPVPANAPLALLFASLVLAVAGWRTLRRRG